MKISIIQFNIAWEDKAANFVKIENLLHETGTGADIYVLPEMFNSGFTLDTERIPEPPLSFTFKWMSGMAAKTGSAICGSYVVKEQNRIFNRWVFVSPEGETYYYDKRHLYSMGGEDKSFTPGNKRIVFEYKGIRICPTVCYDLRFPVWSRNRNDYDLLINSANWPVSRDSVWEILTKARAIENQCYFAAANRTGTDDTGAVYGGNSAIIDAKGKLISTPYGGEDCVISAEIFPEELSEFRNKFPAWKDADEFKIIT